MGTCYPAEAGGGQAVESTLALADARASDFDAVIFCGGPGITEFMSYKSAGPAVRRLLDEMKGADKWITALCMGPAVLADAGMLRGGVPATGFNANEVRNKIENNGGQWRHPEAVVVSGRIITGRDDKAADQFARRLVKALQTGR